MDLDPGIVPGSVVVGQFEIVEYSVAVSVVVVVCSALIVAALLSAPALWPLVVDG